MNWRVAVSVFVLSRWSDALACRCAQRPLAEYFGAADIVAMARLVAATNGADAVALTFELVGDAYKGRPANAETLIIETANSSAACGVAADIGAIYVLFAASTDDGGLRVDSCSGTRIHLSGSTAEPRGFADVPARFVASQLIALQATDILGQVIAEAPQPHERDNASLVGLLDLKALAHGGSMRAFAAPEPDSEVVTVIDSYDDVVSREVGYEVPAAVVYSAVPGWYKVELKEGRHVWLRADAAGTYFAYETLPIRRLAYLTRGWSGLVWPGPGSGLPMRAFMARAAQPEEQAVNLLEATTIGGMPWFRVEILDGGPCSDPAARTRLTGWIPAYGATGQPNAWFYSRGC